MDGLAALCGVDGDEDRAPSNPHEEPDKYLEGPLCEVGSNKRIFAEDRCEGKPCDTTRDTDDNRDDDCKKYRATDEHPVALGGFEGLF